MVGAEGGRKEYRSVLGVAITCWVEARLER